MGLGYQHKGAFQKIGDASIAAAQERQCKLTGALACTVRPMAAQALSRKHYVHLQSRVCGPCSASRVDALQKLTRESQFLHHRHNILPSSCRGAHYTVQA